MIGVYNLVTNSIDYFYATNSPTDLNDIFISSSDMLFLAGSESGDFFLLKSYYS
jgi:hypothetical protein